MNQKGALIGIGFSLVLLVLVAADVQLTGSATIIPKYAQASSSVEGGVARHMNPELPDIFTELNIETQNTDEQGLLVRVVPATATVQRYVLLQNKDRLGFFSMTESPDVRAYFSALKEALQQSFSPEMNNLVDVTEYPEGHPVRNILSFTDPALSDEKLMFVRSRDRLFELHFPEGKADSIKALVDKLTE